MSHPGATSTSMGREMTLVEEAKLLESIGTKRGPGEGWYIIDAEWLKNWKQFVTTGALWKHPGHITNSRLMDLSRQLNSLKPGLEPKKDYRALGKEAWEYLVKQYGGGPSIECKTLDIYAQNSTRIVKVWHERRLDCSVSVKDRLDWMEPTNTTASSCDSSYGSFQSGARSSAMSTAASTAASTNSSMSSHRSRYEERRKSSKSGVDEDTRKSSKSGVDEDTRKSSKSSAGSTTEGSRTGSKETPMSRTSSSKVSNATAKVAEGMSSMLGLRRSPSPPPTRSGLMTKKLSFPSFGRTFEV